MAAGQSLHARVGSPKLLTAAAEIIFYLGPIQRGCLIFACGLLAALSQAPFHLFGLLWISFPVFVWCLDGIDRSDSRRFFALNGFIAGWLFGFGYFFAGLWWVGAAFLVEAERLAWIMPFAVVTLPAMLAVFWGLAVGTACWFWTSDWRRVVWLALWLSAAELMRSWLFTGFPWNLIGYSLAPNPVMGQALSLVGSDSFNLFAVLLFSSPALLVGSFNNFRSGAVLFGCALTLLVIQILYGTFLLKYEDSGSQNSVSAILLQPNIEQKKKWDPLYRQENIDLVTGLTKKAVDQLGTQDMPAYILWPETALPVWLARETSLLKRLSDILPHNVYLIAGSNRYEFPNPQQNPSDVDIYNSLLIINSEGMVTDHYDKSHLVPFGEYIPFENILRRLGITLIAGAAQFAEGTSRKILNLEQGGKILPAICYEIIFPVSGHLVSEADWILNLTNDAWYAGTIGPDQHFFHAQLRSILTGRPVVRVANSGISGVFDAHGRIVQRTNFGEEKVLAVKIPMGKKKEVSIVKNISIFAVIFLALCSITAFRIRNLC